MKIGDEEITSGLLAIGQMNELVGFGMLIGADFFLSHHVYVANSQDRLYFTYGGGRVFNLPSTDDPPSPAAAGGPTAPKD